MSEMMILQLAALVVLVACLCVSVGIRWRTEEARQREFERQWPPTVLDVAAVSPQIQRLRQDYVAAARRKAARACSSKERFAVTKRAIRSLPYFRDLVHADSADRVDHEHA